MTKKTEKRADERKSDEQRRRQDGGGTTNVEKQLLTKGHIDDSGYSVTQSTVAYNLSDERQLLEEGYVYDNEDLVVARSNTAYSKTGQTITYFFLLSAPNVPAFQYSINLFSM